MGSDTMGNRRIMKSARLHTRGFTLIASLLMLLLLSGIAIGLMMMVNTEGKVGGTDLQNDVAFHSAEGGIGAIAAEALGLEGVVPLRRNPAYDPIVNPDRALQLNQIQYIATDVWSAQRSPFFDALLRRYVSRYHGVLVYKQYADATDSSGQTSNKVVIEIYEVRP